MKRGLLGILPILLINFASAVSYTGYNRFSITGFFDSINPNDLIFMTVFIIVLAIVNFATGKFFKDEYGNPNKAVSGIISLSVALIVAYSLYKTNFNLEGLFYGIGISEEMLFLIIPLIFLVGSIIVLWKLNIAWLTFTFGSMLILMTALGFIYEKGIAMSLGIFLALVGAVWILKKRINKKRAERGGYGYGGGYGRPSKSGFFRKKLDQYQSHSLSKSELKNNQRLAQQERDYERDMHNKEVRERAGKINQIRGRRERMQQAQQQPTTKRGWFGRGKDKTLAAGRTGYDAAEQKYNNRQARKKQEAESILKDMEYKSNALRNMIEATQSSLQHVIQKTGDVAQRGQIEKQLRKLMNEKSQLEKKARQLRKRL